MEKEPSNLEVIFALVFIVGVCALVFYIGQATSKTDFSNIKVDCYRVDEWKAEKIKGTELYGYKATKNMECEATKYGKTISSEIFFKTQNEINAMFKE